MTFCASFIHLEGQQLMDLWEGDIPNRVIAIDEKEEWEKQEIIRIANVQIPTMEIFLPAKRNANGMGVIICPGGGYQRLAYDWEGTDIAKLLNSKGIAAFVLKYRLPSSKNMINNYETPLLDAQQALRIVRKKADEYNLNPNNIGIMGFSAGGHLASTLATHYDYQSENNAVESHEISARPDFAILIYPVITMDENFTHKGSKVSLLGENPDQQRVDYFSNEKHVTNHTPPTFIIHSQDDKAVPVQNALLMYDALLENNVPVTMHLFPNGGHGYGLAHDNEHLKKWSDLLIDWLNTLK